jgi:hypothetical protein
MTENYNKVGRIIRILFMYMHTGMCLCTHAHTHECAHTCAHYTHTNKMLQWYQITVLVLYLVCKRASLLY